MMALALELSGEEAKHAAGWILSRHRDLLGSAAVIDSKLRAQLEGSTVDPESALTVQHDAHGAVPLTLVYSEEGLIDAYVKRQRTHAQQYDRVWGPELLNPQDTRASRALDLLSRGVWRYGLTHGPAAYPQGLWYGPAEAHKMVFYLPLPRRQVKIEQSGNQSPIFDARPGTGLGVVLSLHDSVDHPAIAAAPQGN